MSEYQFDFHTHVPLRRIRETLAKAILRGLNAVAFTDYDSTFTFDHLVKNDFNGEPVLDTRGWKIQQLDDYLLRISKGEEFKIEVIRGEEVKSKEGDILAIGIRRPVAGGLSAQDTIERIYKQSGIVVFPHLAASYFGGCGEEVFRNVQGKFPGLPLALEVNAQYPEFFPWNNVARKLGIEHNLPVFAHSDIHGNYLKEHEKIGLKYHTSIHGIFSNDPISDLKKAMLERPGSFREEGNANNILETLAWNVHSFWKHCPSKSKSTLEGFLRGLKLTF